MADVSELLEALDQAVGRTVARGPVAIMFSGGLDSGLLAALARRHGRPRLYTVGVEGAHDLRMAEEAATLLDLPWVPVVLSAEGVIEACRHTLSLAPIDSPVVLSFELPLQILASRVEEPMLMSGQGADEMFGGYNRYLDMSGERLKEAMAADLEKVLSDGVPLDNRIAGHYGKEIAHPFLDPPVRRLAAAMPMDKLLSGGVRKLPLRSMLGSLDLAILAAREKKAAQYGSGFMKVIRSVAKRSGLDLRDYVASLRPEQCR